MIQDMNIIPVHCKKQFISQRIKNREKQTFWGETNLISMYQNNQEKDPTTTKTVSNNAFLYTTIYK